MTVALNMLLVVVVLLLMVTAYRIKKVWPLVCAVAFAVVYTTVQPSYMPKGTVKQLPSVPFEPVNTPIVDRVLKPKSGEQYDAERKAEIDEINTRIKNAIQQSKQTN